MNEDKKLRQKMYADLRDELYKRQLSNTESFDKSVLSLSSAGLAISLTFIKFIVPIEQAQFLFFLYSSWVLFGLSIVSTITSLITSQFGIDKQLLYAEEYYINEKEEYLNKNNIAADATIWLNRISALFFILAIASVVTFATLNFNQSDHSNNEKNKSIKKEFEMSKGKNKIFEGATVPKIQKISKKGATVPNIQQVPQTQGTSQGTGSQSGNAQGGSLNNDNGSK